MTFSLVARCERTGSLGVACATADIAIGGRAPFARAGVGAALTQHRTDPRLGPRLLGLLRSGATAAEAVAGAAASTDAARWRQLAVIGTQGPAAAWSGSLVDRASAFERADLDHAVVGNVLAGPEVGPAISSAFAAAATEELAERLVRALEAGLAAGGERDPLRSAAILVVRGEPFPLVDLRVDEHAVPLGELRRLWDLYRPRVEEFERRALAPDTAEGVSAAPGSGGGR